MDTPVRFISLIDEIHTVAIQEYGAMSRYIKVNQFEEHIGFRITTLAHCSEVMNGIKECYAIADNSMPSG